MVLASPEKTQTPKGSGPGSKVVTAMLVRHTGGHDDYFRADKAAFYVVLLTIGYLGSRGLAKSGSRDPYWADE